MSMKTQLQINNTDLQSILDTINTLPEEMIDAYAVINVTYPEGSVCTCSNGNRTIEFDNTLGYGFFLVDEGGEWTVSCTDGTNTKSQSVEITTEGQVESVRLTYELILIENGIVSELLGSFSKTDTTDESAVYFSKNDSSGYGSAKTGTSTLSVNASGYDTLKLLAKGQAKDSASGQVKCIFGEAEIVLFSPGVTVEDYTEYSLDISSIESAAVSFYLLARNGTSKLYVSDLWLE